MLMFAAAHAAPAAGTAEFFFRVKIGRSGRPASAHRFGARSAGASTTTQHAGATHQAATVIAGAAHRFGFTTATTAAGPTTSIDGRPIAPHQLQPLNDVNAGIELGCVFPAIDGENRLQQRLEQPEIFLGIPDFLVGRRQIAPASIGQHFRSRKVDNSRRIVLADRPDRFPDAFSGG